MPYLLDTNIVLRLVNPTDPHHAPVRRTVRLLRRRGDELFFTSQVLAEFWSVCTRRPQRHAAVMVSPSRKQIVRRAGSSACSHFCRTAPRHTTSGAVSS